MQVLCLGAFKNAFIYYLAEEDRELTVTLCVRACVRAHACVCVCQITIILRIVAREQNVKGQSHITYKRKSISFHAMLI